MEYKLRWIKAFSFTIKFKLHMEIKISISKILKNYENLYPSCKEIDDHNLFMIACTLVVDSALGVAQSINQVRHPFTIAMVYHIVQDYLLKKRYSSEYRETYMQELFENLTGNIFRTMLMCSMLYKSQSNLKKIKEPAAALLAPLREEIGKELLCDNLPIETRLADIQNQEMNICKSLLVLAWENLLTSEISESFRSK